MLKLNYKNYLLAILSVLTFSCGSSQEGKELRVKDGNVEFNHGRLKSNLKISYDKINKALIFTIENKGRKTIIVTEHIGYLSATVGEGSEVRHIAQDGSNADLKGLTLKDLISIKPGMSHSLKLMLTQGKELKFVLGAKIKCTVNPIRIGSFDPSDQKAATKLKEFFIENPVHSSLEIVN